MLRVFWAVASELARNLIPVTGIAAEGSVENSIEQPQCRTRQIIAITRGVITMPHNNRRKNPVRRNGIR